MGCCDWRNPPFRLRIVRGSSVRHKDTPSRRQSPRKQRDEMPRFGPVTSIPGGAAMVPCVLQDFQLGAGSLSGSVIFDREREDRE
ncbi:hypothetical protein PF003_g24513 [Phytophthora fragariae]|nr:hypothetical protein PF003_g24513 [Phytophthora fragariae]